MLAEGNLPRQMACRYIGISVRTINTDDVRGGPKTNMTCCSVIILILRVTLFYHQDQHLKAFTGLGCAWTEAGEGEKTYIGHDGKLEGAGTGTEPVWGTGEE